MADGRVEILVKLLEDDETRARVDKLKGTLAGIFFCVPVFILSGFEHSIANMFYFGASGIVNIDMIVYILVVIAGNSIGGMAMPILNILGKGEPKNA